MNWSKFFSMGGYAFYVWGSYAVALIAMGGEVVLLLRRKKTLVARLGDLNHGGEGDTYENKA
ncbi:MAG TPA: heme exporter protein CcmD [Pyrinomonadaceae bacterium]|nr:heme exporter protein CcmD [Pyrinomonadaceae bacterium]